MRKKKKLQSSRSILWERKDVSLVHTLASRRNQPRKSEKEEEDEEKLLYSSYLHRLIDISDVLSLDVCVLLA